MLNLGLCQRLVTPCRQVIVISLDLIDGSKPPFLSPLLTINLLLPSQPVRPSLVVSSHKIRQVILFNCCVVLGIQLITIVVGMKKQDLFGAAALLENQYRGLHT